MRSRTSYGEHQRLQTVTAKNLIAGEKLSVYYSKKY